MPRLKQTSAILLELKLPVAVAEGWTIKRLAAECHCGRDAAGSALRRYRGATQQQSQVELGNQAVSLAHRARKARDADLADLERHAALVERAMVQLEESEDLSIGDLAKLTALRGQHHKLVESITGIDVAKQIAVRRETAKDGAMISWDGVEALEAMPLELL